MTIHISEPRSVSECDVNVCTFNAEHPLEPRFPNTVYGKVMWRQINIFKNILFMRHFMFFAQLFSFISKFLILSLVLTYLVLRSPFGRATVLQCTWAEASQPLTQTPAEWCSTRVRCAQVFVTIAKSQCFLILHLHLQMSHVFFGWPIWQVILIYFHMIFTVTMSSTFLWRPSDTFPLELPPAHKCLQLGTIINHNNKTTAKY